MAGPIAALAASVARRHERREEVVHHTLVTARPPVANLPRTIEHREKVLEAGTGSRAGIQGWLGTPLPDFEVEQLTDRVMRRIDGKYIAHKERLGKLF